MPCVYWLASKQSQSATATVNEAEAQSHQVHWSLLVTEVACALASKHLDSSKSVRPQVQQKYDLAGWVLVLLIACFWQCSNCSQYVVPFLWTVSGTHVLLKWLHGVYPLQMQETSKVCLKYSVLSETLLWEPLKLSSPCYAYMLSLIHSLLLWSPLQPTPNIQC